MSTDEMSPDGKLSKNSKYFAGFIIVTSMIVFGSFSLILATYRNPDSGLSARLKRYAGVSWVLRIINRRRQNGERSQPEPSADNTAVAGADVELGVMES